MCVQDDVPMFLKIQQPKNKKSEDVINIVIDGNIIKNASKENTEDVEKATSELGITLRENLLLDLCHVRKLFETA